MVKRNNSSLGKSFNKRKLFKHIYFEENHDLRKTIIIEGVGRSGTTWLAENLAEILNYRLIFEPFKPEFVNIFKNMPYKEYLPPNYDNEEYLGIFSKILSGEIKNKWIDQDNRVFRPKGRVVKSIRASFYLKWIKNNFPEIPIIFMMRHPCAVTLSRTKLGWSESELDLFLKQDPLIQDHLRPYIDVITRAKSLIQKNACIWCIQNLIAFNTMESDDWIITTYENLFTNPEDEMKRILKYIGIEKVFNAEKFKGRFSLQTFKDSAVVADSNPLEFWRKALSKNEISEILEIVKGFGFDNIYSAETMPIKKFN